MAELYDLIVIGSGGGSILADSAAESGHKAAMIEAKGWGGTCLNRGCIPTKIMVHAADLIRESERSRKIAVRGEPLTIDWPALKKRVFSKIAEGESMPDYYAPYSNIRLYKALAVLAGKEKILGKERFAVDLKDSSRPDGAVQERIYADRLLLANGGRTHIPQGAGFEESGFLSSEILFSESGWPDELPESMIIIGGGDIGAEFAHIFSAFGVRVKLVQHNKRLVPKQDHEISARLRQILEKNGVEIYLNCDTLSSGRKNGRKYLKIRERETSELQLLEAEEFFIAPGIVPNSDSLKTESLGIACDAKGWIKTNEFLETNVENVYALGDINGRAQLRHKANYEASVLAYNLFGPGSEAADKRRKVSYDFVPAGTFSAMQIGTVGLTEEEAVRRNIPHKVGRLDFSATAQGYARGYLPGDPDDGFAKVIVTADGKKFLGMHVIAPEASSLVQPYVYLMAAGGEFETAPDDPEIVRRAMTIHPSLAELPAWSIGAWREDEKR